MLDVIIFYIIFIIVIVWMDLQTNTTRECLTDNPNAHVVILNLIVHHAIFIFVGFGWIVFNKPGFYIYLLISLLVCLCWVLKGGKCILTQMYNEQCNLDRDAESYNTFINLIFNEKGTKWIYNVSLVCITLSCVGVLYKLCRT